jgi:hypothetical protein
MQPLVAVDAAQVTVAGPQLSMAVIVVLQVGSTVGLQPSSVLPGVQFSNTGGVVSTVHVAVRVHVVVLRQTSRAVYTNVRVVTQPLVASVDAHVTVAGPQLSVAVMVVRQIGSVVGLQPSGVLPGTQLVNTGGVVSTVHVNVRVHVVELRQTSRAV